MAMEAFKKTIKTGRGGIAIIEKPGLGSIAAMRNPDHGNMAAMQEGQGGLALGSSIAK